MAAYDRRKEVEEFDSSKMGVKGLSDSSITSIPKIFIHPPETLSTLKSSQDDTTIAIPVIDLAKINSPVDRPNIIQQVKEAAKSWGFFQVINHGIDLSVVENTIQAVKSFHEQPAEMKAKFY
ncbi:hypothetical protein Patl1_32575 [Pistacia atlantica]|nr:hypothetical protein Patl1_32575 [Pistacia atlantica]